MNIYNSFSEFALKEKIRLFIVFLIMCIAFSLPFGHIYANKIISVILILWLFTVNKKDIIEIFKNKVYIVISLFIFTHIISLLWSEDVMAGYSYIGRMLHYIYFPILIFVTIIKKDDIKYILDAFVFGMFTNEIISYLIYFDLYETTYSLKHHYPVGFINHIMYSVLVAFSSVLILFQAKNTNNKYLKGIYILFFITMTINLVISSGRTGYIVYFVSLVVLLFTYYKISWKKFFQLLLFPVIIFYIGYKLNEDVQKRIEASVIAIDNIYKYNNYNTSFGARIASYRLLYDILSQENNSFIFGMGMGNMKQEIKEANIRTGLVSGNFFHLHNQYLEAYLNAGIIAFILLILILYFIATLNIKNKEMNFVKQLIIINISVAMLSGHTISVGVGMFYFSIFVSLLLVQEKYEYKRGIDE